MTSAAFVVRMAWREGHAARRRLALLTASVVAGVGALVAVNSFTRNLTVAVADQAQALLGADLSLTSRGPIDDVKPARRLLDSLQRSGGSAVHLATSVNFAAMAFRPGSGSARLVRSAPSILAGHTTAASPPHPATSGCVSRTATRSSTRRC